MSYVRSRRVMLVDARFVGVRSALARLSLVGLAACAGESDPSEADALVDLTEIAPGDTCPEGGVQITLGTDVDGDGALSDEEIASTQTLCSGQPTTSTDVLVVTTDLPVGDPSCPFGGVELAAGFDDGGTDGVAGDGVLQPSEIDDVTYLCKADAGYYRGELVEPVSPAGAYRIDAHGGSTPKGVAGGGGAVHVGSGTRILAVEDPGNLNDVVIRSSDYGLPGGAVVVYATGRADASFTPPPVAANLGAVPAVFEADTTLEAYPDANCDGTPDDTQGLSDGDLYQIDCFNLAAHEGNRNWNSIWVWGSPPRQVTGIHVRPGVEVAFPDTTTAQPSLRPIVLDADILNEGTITMEQQENHAVSVFFQSAAYLGTPGSAIVANAPTELTRPEDRCWVRIETTGAIVQLGTIEGEGRGSTPGANVVLRAGASLWNTGDILVSGDPASGHASGSAGGSVELRAGFNTQGSLYNSGFIDARGGGVVKANQTGASGQGGTVQFNAGLGSVFNSGAIDASGGASAGSDCGSNATCRGGDGGEIVFVSQVGDLVSSGDLSAAGGAGEDGGGVGGAIHLFIANSTRLGMGRLDVSGNLDVSGGGGVPTGTKSASGGGGGMIEIGNGGSRTVVTVPSRQTEIVLYGYIGIDVSGGHGNAAGAAAGAGGLVRIQNSCPRAGEVLSGPAGIFADVDGRGGDNAADSAEASGGAGGRLEALACVYNEEGTAPGARVVIGGAVDVSGGAALEGLSGGHGGRIYGFVRGDITVADTLSASGGDGWTQPVVSGGHINLMAWGGWLELAGDLDVYGGDGQEEGDGGGGGSVIASADRATCSGNIDAFGGSTVHGQGGDGGTVALSTARGGATCSGVVDVGGGFGKTDGADGYYSVDGTAPNGTKP